MFNWASALIKNDNECFYVFNNLSLINCLKNISSRVLAYKQQKFLFTKLTRNEGLGKIFNIRQADGWLHREEWDIGWVWSEHYWHWTPGTTAASSQFLDTGYSCCGWNEFSTDFFTPLTTQSDSEVVAKCSIFSKTYRATASSSSANPNLDKY